MSPPLNTPLGRFGIVTSEEGPHGCIASIPAGGMTNPLTGLPTASLHVNFMRQFRISPESPCVGTVLRVGRGSAVAEAQAVGDDGKVAIIARLTAYLR
jgi:acyl-coenzyme A thioesterase PaaI-like protein